MPRPVPTVSRLAALAGLLACAACAGGDEVNEAARQALQDGRASLAALGAEAAPPARPAPPALRPEPGSLAGGRTVLTGSTPEEVLAMLGEPSLRRSEGPVAVWLYAAAGCQLDVMFYPGAAGLRVAHAQARAGGFAQRSEAACLRDLATDGRARPQGSGLPAELGA